MTVGNQSFTQVASEAATTYREHGGKIGDAVGTLAYLMLITTEVAEAAEEVRRGEYYGRVINSKPEGLPSELADIVIRTMVLADTLGINLEHAIIEKNAYNKTRLLLKQEGKCL